MEKINYFENFWAFRFLFHDGCISSLRIIFYIPFCRELNGESSARNSLILEREDRDQTSKYWEVGFSCPTRYTTSLAIFLESEIPDELNRNSIANIPKFPSQSWIEITTPDETNDEMIDPMKERDLLMDHFNRNGLNNKVFNNATETRGHLIQNQASVLVESADH